MDTLPTQLTHDLDRKPEGHDSNRAAAGANKAREVEEWWPIKPCCDVPAGTAKQYQPRLIKQR